MANEPHEFQVNTLGDGYRFWPPAMSADALGTFVIAWTSGEYDENYNITSSRVSVQRFRVEPNHAAGDQP